MVRHEATRTKRLILRLLVLVTAAGNVLLHAVHYFEMRRTGRRN